ncbi:50S ribosomal protein L17 [Patescibacteria group bacterium]|nr:50S ribosomal protein L17 [Patescibacteria group bacterium]
MRHRVQKNHFNRNTNERKALLKSLLRNLIEQGEIVTTDGKAKEIKRLMDKLVYKAKTDTVENRRLLHRVFGRRDVVNTLFVRVAPAMKERVSGFTSISKNGSRRGDSAQMVTLKFVAEYDRTGTLSSGKTYEAKAEAKPVAKKAPAKKAEAQKATKKVEKK